MTDKTLGEYKRTTPDPDETTGEALARLQAELTRLLDEADAELRDEADGGVAAALIEQEAEQHDAAETSPLTPDAITDDARDRAYRAVAALSVCDWDDMSGVAKGRAMALVEAVITEITRPEPPARPEGAEEIEFLIADRLGGDVPGDVIRVLADEIAERAGATRLYPEDGAA